MFGAGMAAVIFRVNLPVALAITLHTNRLTIVPLCLLARRFGTLVFGASTGRAAEQPPGWIWNEPLASLVAFVQRTLGLGAPLALGLLLLGSTLALVGYLAARTLWSAHMRRTWIVRRRHCAAAPG